MSIKLDVSSLTDKLDKISNISLTKALNRAAIVVENAAKINCPVDTGQLRNSITHNVEGNIAEIGTNTEYGPYVEYGTGLFAVHGDGRQDPWVYQDEQGNWHYTTGQMPLPFLEPALLDNTEEIKLIFEQAVQEELNNA